LRPNEALLLALVAGLCLYHLPRRQRRPISDLDLAVGSFTVGGVAVAFLVLFLSDSAALLSQDTIREVLSPAQFLVVYLVFSRTEFSSRGLHAILNLTMLASVLVGLVAIAELVDLHVRELMAAYYAAPARPPGWDPVYRPTSTIGHYSAVGAFGALNYTLALSLATMRHPAFSGAWLSLVMAVNLAAVVASLTWAPLVVLPLVTGMVLWYGRRLPRELGMTALALGAAFVLLWPSVGARIAEQGVSPSAGQALTIPQTFDTRLRHWEEFFLPALADHAWLGTGTVIPSQVPTALTDFVDNEYIREGFRAGILGVTLLLIMLITIAVVGWRSRASPDSTRRSLGGACLALVVFFALVGMTAEYLFFGGVSQEFAMMIGLLGASRPVEARAPMRSPVGTSLPLAGAGARLSG